MRGILFDKDGVLVDFHATWSAAAGKVIDDTAAGDRGLARALSQSIGYDLRRRRFNPGSPFIAGSSAESVRGWAEALGQKPTMAFHNTFASAFARAGQQTLRAYDDVADTLAALGRRGLALGVATNDGEASARQQLNQLGIAGRFTYVAGFDSGYGPKPGGGMVRAFLDHIDAAPGEVMMIGDTLHDIRAAREAGVTAVAVATGPEDTDTISPYADHTIDRLADVLRLLEG